MAELTPAMLDPELALNQARDKLASLEGVVLREGEPMAAHTDRKSVV